MDKQKGLIAGLLKAVLFILSLVYGLIVRIAIVLCRLNQVGLGCKVISVGNITLGGTGKTSLVEYIARCLKQNGHKVAIISRGYRGGDEPYMLSKKLSDIPVIVDSNRLGAGKLAIAEYQADTVILDDAFQQWKIKKDLEIVAIDAANPFGNYHMLPRGIMREPLSALARADIFILTKTNLDPDTEKTKKTLRQINPGAEIFESLHSPLGFYNIAKPDDMPRLELARGKTVILFSGIGDPGSFEGLITALGAKVARHFRFRDHHHYAQGDLDKIYASAKELNIDTVITTEKDAARLYSLQLRAYSLGLLVLRIQLEIKDEQRFRDRLFRLYSG